MPTTFTPGDNKQGDKLNPGQQHADQRFKDIAKAEEDAAFNNIADNYDQDADSDQEDANIERARQGESNTAQGAPGAPAPWANRTGSEGVEVAKKAVTKFTLKKAAPLIGGAGIIGIIIFLLGGWLPTMLLPSLSQGAMSENDTRGTLLERRLVAKLQQKMGNGEACDTKLSLCRDKKLPKVMIDSMTAKGIVAVDSAGNPTKIEADANGYAKENPTHFKFTDSNGQPKIIPATDFVNEYRKNAVFRKTFKTAYNTRYISYTGKFMKGVLEKWGMKKNGGSMADPEFTEANANEKLAEAVKAGGIEGGEGGAKTKFTERVKTLLKRTANKAKKTDGDPIIMVGSVACMAIEMPTFIAGTIRAIQLAQVVALTSNFLLSASDMVRAGDADPEQVSATGKVLTDTYPVEGSDVAKSAVDSSILLAATGAATGVMLKPTKYVPGYSIFNDSRMKGAMSADKATKEACNLINSPQAAFASAALTGVIGGATGGIGAGVKLGLQGITRLAIAFGAIEGVMAVLEATGALDAIAGGALQLATGLLGNIYEDAKGVEFGDALGTGLFAVFSLAALGGGAAVLTKSQARTFKQVAAEVDDQYRQEDIATLSPFDTSSRYTFLGSIVSKLAVSSAGESNMTTTAIKALGAIATAPFQMFNKSASAEVDPIEAKFGYAAEFGVNEDIAVTVAGTPGTGLPVEYLSMTPEDAYNTVIDQIDVETGDPNEDSDLATTVGDCAEADLESMSGCTVQSSTSQTISLDLCNGDAECEESQSSTSSTIVDDVSAKKSAAMRIYYMDHQLENVFSGKDEDKGGSSAASTAGANIDRDHLWDESTSVACATGTNFVRDDRGYNQGQEIAIKLCGIPNTNHGGSPMLVNSRASGAVLAMINKMRADLSIDTIKIADSFRTMESQEHAWNCNQGNPNGENCSDIAGRAAQPGYSNHQSGYAIDFQLPSGNSGSTKPGDAYWDWLSANAATFGYSSNVGESWHWSVTGG